jgi:hypothetical protein
MSETTRDLTMSVRSHVEFRYIAHEFARKHLPFLDRNWLQEVFLDNLAALLAKTVKEHTSKTSNTALREAAEEAVGLADHAIRYLPSGARKCRCSDLDNGEHAQQPICHVCALNRIRGISASALEKS